MNTEFLGRRIRSVRESLGLSLSEFSDKLDIGIDVLAKVEHGDAEADFSMLTAIAEIYPQFSAYLLTGMVPPKNRNPQLECLSKDMGISERLACVVRRRWFK